MLDQVTIISFIVLKFLIMVKLLDILPIDDDFLAKNHIHAKNRLQQQAGELCWYHGSGQKDAGLENVVKIVVIFQRMMDFFVKNIGLWVLDHYGCPLMP